VATSDYRELSAESVRLADILVKQMRKRGASDAEIVVELAKAIHRPRTLGDAISKALDRPSSPNGTFIPFAEAQPEALIKHVAGKKHVIEQVERIQKDEAAFQKKRERVRKHIRRETGLGGSS
jgi:hypothetical protein